MKEKPINLDKFENYTIKDMFEYIQRADIKFCYLFDIFSYKFDKQYNTPDKRRALFEGLDLAAISEFANVYNPVDGLLDPTLEEIWVNKSLKEYGNVLQPVEDILKGTKAKHFTFACMEELYDFDFISQKQFKIINKMIQIIQTLLATDMSYTYFDTFEECDKVMSLLNFIYGPTEDIKIPKLLRLPEAHIIKLVDNYEKLEAKLDLFEG